DDTPCADTPSVPPPPPALPPEGPWRSYKEKVALLADRIIEAQKPIRILNALKWEAGVWDAFRKSRFREPPKIDAESYARVDLGFDPVARARDYQGLADDVRRTLGADDAIMVARELDKVGVEVDMLITLDPTRPPLVPKNVKVVYNYYQPSIWDGTGILRGIPLTAEPGFRGQLHNMNVRAEYKHLLEWDTNHVNIDKNSKIHADAIARILAICPPREQWTRSRASSYTAGPTTRPVAHLPEAGGDGRTARVENPAP
ncbi:MAG: hypothetical protein NZP34_13800, partial [Caldilineales bacterium]|nr:hypothetical protein [Caldilineales bacterium]